MNRIRNPLDSLRCRTAFLLLLAPVMALAEGPSPGMVGAGSLLWQMEQGYATASLINTDVTMQDQRTGRSRFGQTGISE